MLCALLAGAVPARAAAAEAGAGPSGTQLRVAIKDLPPFVVLGDGAPQGFSLDLLEKLAARADFGYELVTVESVGEQLDQVADGRADLAIAGISITSTREAAVDFTHPMFRSGLQVLIPATAEASPSLPRTVLNAVVPLALRVAVLLIVVAHLVWLFRSRSDSGFPKDYLKGVGEGLWFAAESLATVSYGDGRPGSIIGRLAAVAWMFLAIFVVANLTGEISADLVEQRIEGGIGGPNDLAGHRVASVPGTTSDDYLRSRLLEPVPAPTTEDAVEMLMRREVDAVVMDSPVLRYYAAGPAAGQVKLAGPMFSPQDYGIALPAGSELREPLNRALLELVENGTYARLERSWFGDLV